MENRDNHQAQYGRRWFLRTLRYGFMLGSGVLGWSVGIEPHWLTVSYHPLSLPNLPQEWCGSRLIQVSDLHIGKVNLSYLVRAMECINALSPDLIVITGDFINHSSPQATAEVRTVLETLKPTPLGIFGCLGNHDYGHAWSDLTTADRIADAVQTSGITLLRNAMFDVAGVRIIGLDDFWSPKFDAKGILRQAVSNQPTLCLCHNPDVCDQAVWGEFRGVILSGHTHGGQCKPPFLPAPITPVVNKRYAQGFYQVHDGNTLYINRGLGYTRRVRLNCRPEISVFELLGEPG